MANAMSESTWARFPEFRASAGQSLLDEGDDSGAMLVLVDGEVRVEARGTTLARISEPGSVIGEMAGLLDVARSATVVAETDVVCRRVDDVVALIREDPDAALAIARMLAHRLHLLDAYLADVKAQYADRGDHLGMLDTVLGALATASPIDIEPGSDREYEPNQ